MALTRIFFIVNFIVIISSFVIANNENQNANLVIFMNNSIKAFRHDLIQTPLVFEDETEVNLSKADYTLEGIVSQVSYPGLSSTHANYINGDLQYGRIHVECDLETGIYAGSFNLSGKVVRDQTTFGGVGTWTLSPYGRMWFSQNNQLSVIEDFVVLSQPNAYLGDNSFVTANFSVELFEGAPITETLKTKVIQDLGIYLRDHFRRRVESFLRSEMFANFQRDFDQVSLPDILAGMTLPPRTTTVGCVYNLKDALTHWGHELVISEGDEVVLSSEIVSVEDGQVKVEVITKKTMIISAA